jgi:hypothetical protein
VWKGRAGSDPLGIACAVRSIQLIESMPCDAGVVVLGGLVGLRVDQEEIRHSVEKRSSLVGRRGRREGGELIKHQLCFSKEAGLTFYERALKAI